ncbi:MAG: decaprenyl-phosphate phosphoribosyltransferase [Chloroflexi bacterium]|nr:decaprenyl-phosphate phosphoribosyltransferase [Chloroflexota bacterium]
MKTNQMPGELLKPDLQIPNDLITPPANNHALPMNLLLAMRPKQWTKNGIIVAGLVFSLNLFQPVPVALTFAALVIFCLLSSAIYLVNDVVDIEKDKQHPLKRLRPIAAGLVPAPLAIGLSAAIVGVLIPVSLFINIGFGAVAITYVATMFAYSFFLKHILIIDVFVLAAGFVLRAMSGAVIIHVAISPWLYVCTVLLALFLGLSKRRHELLLLDAEALNHRKILQEYSAPLLEEMISVVSSATIMAYSLYTFSAENLPKNHYMMFTIPFVLYAIFRYLYLVYRKDEGGSPEQLLLTDIPLIADILVWGIAAIGILYFFKF